LAEDLATDGVQAKGFAADVRQPSSIATALEQVTETLGPIEVLQYSPLPQKDFMRPVLETTPADLVGPVEFSIYGPVAAGAPGGAGHALPRQEPRHHLVRQRRVRSAAGPQRHGHFGGRIIAGDAEKDPDKLAGHLWDLHTRRDRFRHQVSAD